MGTLYRIYDIMNIAIDIERNNSSGLLTLTFTIFLLIIEIVIILTFAIIRKTKKNTPIKEQFRQSGDGSVIDG